MKYQCTDCMHECVVETDHPFNVTQCLYGLGQDVSWRLVHDTTGVVVGSWVFDTNERMYAKVVSIEDREVGLLYNTFNTLVMRDTVIKSNAYINTSTCNASVEPLTMYDLSKLVGKVVSISPSMSRYFDGMLKSVVSAVTDTGKLVLGNGRVCDEDDFPWLWVTLAKEGIPCVKFSYRDKTTGEIIKTDWITVGD